MNFIADDSISSVSEASIQPEIPILLSAQFFHCKMVHDHSMRVFSESTKKVPLGYEYSELSIHHFDDSRQKLPKTKLKTFTSATHCLQRPSNSVIPFSIHVHMPDVQNTILEPHAPLPDCS
jgi:hypothetical protein